MAPWSTFWDRNFFAEALPSLELILASPFSRGAVSGVGLVTVLGGLAEISGAFTARRAAAAPHPPTLRSDR